MLFVGTQYYRPPNPREEDWARDLDLVRECGLSVVRCWLYWSRVNPRDGEWVWDDYDRFLEMAAERGLKVLSTYQLNIGGNMDFLNMIEESRLKTKRISKTEAVTSMIPYEVGARVGPSDYVPFLGDRKVMYMYMEAEQFGGFKVYLDVKLSVMDSPNAAGVAIDAIRAVKLAMDRGISGPLEGVSAYFFKHPPRQLPDYVARELVESFIRGEEVKVEEVLKG